MHLFVPKYSLSTFAMWPSPHAGSHTERSRQVLIRDNVFEERSRGPRRRREVIKTVLRFKPLSHNRVGRVLFSHCRATPG